MSSELNLNKIKAELKNHGCKLKTQLDGSWAIHEPRGKRVIVPTLEAVHEYCLAKTTASDDKFSSGTVHEKGQIIPQGVIHIPEKQPTSSSVDVVPSEPVLFDAVLESALVGGVKLEPAVGKFTEPLTDPVPEKVAVFSEKVTPEIISGAVFEPVQILSPQVSASAPAVDREVDVLHEDNSAIRLSQLRTDLKKLGCKLKSQLDGSWCIDESKGRRTIVPTLQAVQEYIDVKNGKPLTPLATDQIINQPEVKVTRPLTAAVLAEINPLPEIQPEPLVASRIEPLPVPVIKAAVSPEQQEALAIVNQMLRDIKATRLPQGMNFLHSEILPYLQDNNCPKAFLEKAIVYAEAKLQKDCMDKVLVKRTFKNHRDQQDAMYFEFRYANVLSTN